MTKQVKKIKISRKANKRDLLNQEAKKEKISRNANHQDLTPAHTKKIVAVVQSKDIIFREMILNTVKSVYVGDSIG